MAKVSERWNYKAWILPVVYLIILALLAVVPRFDNLYITVLFITILAYIILTVGWVIFSGPTGYVSMAPAAFYGMGMYGAAILGKQLPFAAVIAVTAGISFVFALIVGFVTLRLRGIYFTIFTFGLVLLIQQLMSWYEVAFTHTKGRFVIVLDNNIIYYYMLGTFVVLMITAVLINRSKYGIALRSIGQDEEAASHSGVNVTTLKVITFALGSLFMGAAGAAIATRLTYIDPPTAFNINYSFFPILMAVFGGMTNLVSPVIGAAVFAYLEEILTTRFPYFYMLVFGLIMVLVITFLPNGLYGVIRRWRKGGLMKTDAHT
jgi:branched-chain amino acid transport system permease protein